MRMQSIGDLQALDLKATDWSRMSKSAWDGFFVFRSHKILSHTCKNLSYFIPLPIIADSSSNKAHKVKFLKHIKYYLVHIRYHLSIWLKLVPNDSSANMHIVLCHSLHLHTIYFSVLWLRLLKRLLLKIFFQELKVVIAKWQWFVKICKLVTDS